MKLRVIVQWDSIHRNLMSSVYMAAVEAVLKALEGVFLYLILRLNLPAAQTQTTVLLRL